MFSGIPLRQASHRPASIFASVEGRRLLPSLNFRFLPLIAIDKDGGFAQLLDRKLLRRVGRIDDDLVIYVLNGIFPDIGSVPSAHRRLSSSGVRGWQLPGATS